MQDLMRKLNASSLTLFSIIFFFSSSLIELKLRNPNPSGSSFFCSALSPDGLSLLAFKSAVSADPGSSLADWNEDDEDPCRWPGISCANISGYSFPRVVAVSVSGKNLSGYIPSELGTLIFLRRLNLHGNFLSGPIPPQLSNASSLHSIFLYSNNLSGSLPPSLCNLPRLQNLDLSGNALSGQIPADLRNCRDLQRLLLSRNRFSGEIPAGIWPELGNLVQLDLSSNSFNGSISWDLGDLKSLSGVLNLSHNQFSGEIPTDLGKLPAAVSLDLRGNDLSGEIPQVGALTNQGPTAFLGNPNLCGFPLQNPCKNLSPAPPGAQIPGTPPPGGGSKKGGLRPGLIILISVADAVGVALVGLILVYVYWKLKDHSRGVGCSCTGKTKLGGREEGFFCCSCSWKELLLWSTTKFESSNNSSDEAEDSEKGGGEGDLVSIDKGFSFELDELLRASAYVLGKSGLGIVYKVVLGNGIPVAVRRLGEGGAQRYKEFAAEIQAIGKVRHPNIVRLRAYYWAPDEKLLISDFISNGNLGSALRGRSGQPSLSWALRLKISKRTARGLAYLHECSPRKFVHGDIKPSNILLDVDFNPYVSDFGLIRLISITGNSAASTAGFMGGVLPSAATKPATAPPPLERPNNYRAPEARSPGVNRPTQKWDVYSFGLVLLELLTGKSPEFSAPSPASSSSSPLGAPSTSTSELVRWVRKGFEQENPLSEMVDPALLQEVQAKKEVVLLFHVALACTEADPEARPRMKTICENLERIGS